MSFCKVGEFQIQNYLLCSRRVYAYVGQSCQLSEFRQATLTSFSEAQIEKFISTWYEQLFQRGRIPKAEADVKASKLKELALGRSDLRGLAERPLLLTVMAVLHTFRGELPEDRVELYKWAIDLLFRRWESRVGGEKGLLAMLDVPGLKMSDIESGLYDVANFVHSGDCGDGEPADIREADLRECLKSYLNNDWEKAGQLIDYIRERAGLLIRHKPDAYTFPHRTFQEFMAACHWVDMKDYPSEATQLIRQDPERWRIVFVLSAGVAPRGQAIAAINALCPTSVRSARKVDRAAFVRSEIAAEALLEVGLIKLQQDGASMEVLRRVRDWLVSAMQADAVLNPKERVHAGNLLSRLGDPRFDPDKWYLPNDDELGFVTIPEGDFLMGSDPERDRYADASEQPQHSVSLSEYRISRYPVTVAQFRAFAADAGLELDEDWKRQNRYHNHPVVELSWNDANKYCAWLTEKLSDQGVEARLPTEAQWEKAARGEECRIYPWGDEADYNKANYDNSQVGGTSPVGCFPGGRSLTVPMI